MFSKISTIILILTAAVAMGNDKMTEKIDREAEIAGITEAISGSIKWCLPDKDREKLYAHVAKDSTFFIFHPQASGTIKGFEHFQKYAEANFFDPRFKAISSDIKDLRVNLSQGADVAWFSCLLDDRGEWEGQPVGWKDCRWTGVLEKRDGKWLLVQQHFSLPTEACK